MNAPMAVAPDLPIPISLICGRYLLFSVDAVTYLRQEHHICGVLIGTLPQIPQQNVFLGLPLELMPEEARLLVEKNVAYIVDDVEVHKEGMNGISLQNRTRYMQDLEQQGRQASQLQAGRKEAQREKALKRLEEKNNKSETSPESSGRSSVARDEHGKSDDLLFAPDVSVASDLASSKVTIPETAAFGITPPTSYPLFSKIPPLLCQSFLPEVPPSYPLFAHLHSLGFFLSPGLRFGCQYLAYPGDPLRFHSHFLVVAAEWDEEIDLMDLVVGGRLGTGVKKGFLIGGTDKVADNSMGITGGRVRTFSIEWAGM